MTITAEQRAKHQQYISASRVAALHTFACHPYMTAAKLFREMRGELGDTGGKGKRGPSLHADIGTACEPVLAAHCGLDVIEANDGNDGEWIHPTLPLLAHPDGMIGRWERGADVWEAKTSQMAARYEPDKLPPEVYLQCQALLMCAGSSRVIVSLLPYGHKPLKIVEYEVLTDEDCQSRIAQGVTEFVEYVRDPESTAPIKPRGSKGGFDLPGREANESDDECPF